MTFSRSHTAPTHTVELLGRSSTSVCLAPLPVPKHSAPQGSELVSFLWTDQPEVRGMLEWVGCLEPPDLASPSASEGRGQRQPGCAAPLRAGQGDIFPVCFSFSLLALASAGRLELRVCVGSTSLCVCVCVRAHAHTHSCVGGHPCGRLHEGEASPCQPARALTARPLNWP